MRLFSLSVITLTGFGLSGCSQISNLWNTSDSAPVTTQQAEVLRTTPQQAYQFEEEIYAVDVHDASADTGYTKYASIQPASTQYRSAPSARSPFEGFAVELFNPQTGYTTPASDPREVEFVMLNGKSEITDWTYCEAINRGYLYASEHDFALNPDFEICMRNKGYVLTTEFDPGSKQVLNAMTARLRGLSNLPAGVPGYF